MLKRQIKYVLVFLIIVFVTYCVAWIQYDNLSKKYYNQAMKNYEAGDYVGALKGKKVPKDDGYEFQGGFEQSANVWSSPYALPKPSTYNKSVKMAKKIIDEKIDVQSGTQAFKQYFGMDNGYLADIMLKVGDLYVQQNDTDSAREMYKTVKEAFGNDKVISKKVNSKLNSLGSK